MKEAGAQGLFGRVLNAALLWPDKTLGTPRRDEGLSGYLVR